MPDGLLICLALGEQTLFGHRTLNNIKPSVPVLPAWPTHQLERVSTFPSRLLLAAQCPLSGSLD